MAFTQINGQQIADKSVSSQDFAQNSLDGAILTDNTVMNSKLVTGIEANKVVIADVSNKYTSGNIEDALQEISTNLSMQVTNLNNTIANNKTDVESDLTAQISAVNSIIDTNKTQATNGLNTAVNTLNSTVSANAIAAQNALTAQATTLNQAITDAKTAVESDLTAQVTVLNKTITDNKTAVESDLATQVTTLNQTITDNKTAVESDLATQVTTLNQTITDNKTDAQNALTAQVATLNQAITDAKTAVESDLATQTSSLNASKADLAGNTNQNFNTKALTVAGDILPTGNGTQNIGSSSNRFSTIYVNEAKLSTNTLYIGDTAILGTTANTIMVKADLDQSINMITTGTGITNVTSTAGVTVAASGMNADVRLQASGEGAAVRVTGTREIDVQAPNVNLTGAVAITGATTVQDLSVSGNFTVQGSTTTVNSQQLTVTDNIIEVNKGQVGSGVTAGQAGLKVDRGDVAAYYMVFDEVSDMFQVGMAGQLETIASQNWVNAHMYVHPATHPAAMIVEDTTHRFFTDTERGKLSDIATGAEVNQMAYSNVKVGSTTLTAASKTDTITFVAGTNISLTAAAGIVTINDTYIAPTSYAATMIVEDTTHRFFTDVERTKLSGIATGAQVNQMAYSSVKVGSTTVAADTATDAVTFVAGTNISLTADATAKTVTVNNTYVPTATVTASTITTDVSHRFVTDTQLGQFNNMKQVITGSSNFASMSDFVQITLPTTMANTNYTVFITPTSATNGLLGEVWVIKSTTTIQVYNTGSATGTFDYTLLY